MVQPTTQALHRYIKRAPDPAPGGEVLFVNDTGFPVILHSLAWTFTASAVVAARQALIRLTDRNVNPWQTFCVGTVGAASVTNFVGFEGGVAAAAGGGLSTFAWPMRGLYLDRDWRVVTITSAIDVADQYSVIVADLEELRPRPHYWEAPPYSNEFATIH